MDTDLETAAAVASNSYVTLGDIQQLLDEFERGDASPPLDRGHLDANGHYADEPEYDPDAEVGDPDWREGSTNHMVHSASTPNNSTSMMSPAPASLQPRSLHNPPTTAQATNTNGSSPRKRRQTQVMPSKSRTVEELFVADNLTPESPEKAKLVLALQGRRADLYDDDARLHSNKHAKKSQSNWLYDQAIMK
jgi:hypothetical protein